MESGLLERLALIGDSERLVGDSERLVGDFVIDFRVVEKWTTSSVFRRKREKMPEPEWLEGLCCSESCLALNDDLAGSSHI